MWRFSPLGSHVFALLRKSTNKKVFPLFFPAKKYVCSYKNRNFINFKIALTREITNLNMSSNSVLMPPACVKGLKELNTSLFEKQIQIPCLKVDVKVLVQLKKILHSYVLKMPQLKTVIQSSDAEEMLVLLDPTKVETFLDITDEDRRKLLGYGVTEEKFVLMDKVLNFENWKANEILRAILPEELSAISGHSIVGHILHLNLKEHHLEYKKIIGEILLQKNKSIKTVVNKLDTIDTSFRFFKMEVLAGSENTVTTVKEGNSIFELDFAKVYWNPRLQTEHSRIVEQLNIGDILFDVFAGIGPFAIPAARKKCQVFANDLNPDSFKWLCHNAKRNRVENFVKTFNLDGKEFIIDIVWPNLKKLWSTEPASRKYHIVMNLPAIAADFLETFSGLYKGTDEDVTQEMMPFVHCYCFVKTPSEITVKQIMQEKLGCTLDEDNFNVHFVRNVAPNKDMMRASFRLPKLVIFHKEEPENKRIKIT